MSSKVTKKTLQLMIYEFDLIPMSDSELEVAVTQMQALVDAMRVTKSINLVDVRSSHVFRALTSADEASARATGEPSDRLEDN